MEDNQALLAQALTLHRAGDLDGAERYYRKILSNDPRAASAWHFLGLVLFQRGDIYSASEHLKRALDIRPDHAETCTDFGTMLQAQGDLSAAAAWHERAVALDPNLAAAHFNLGNTLRELNQLKHAERCYRRVVDLRPDHSKAYNNLGIALRWQGKIREAITCYQAAIELNRRDASARVDLGNVYTNDRRLQCAADSYALAVGLDQRNADAHTNLSTLLLMQGNFDQGWSEYEWRLATDQCYEREFKQPRWNGEPLAGKTILVWAEQGLGDTLQFVRYAAMVKRQGATVVFECQPALMPLLSVGAGSGDPRTTLARLGIDRLIGQRQVQSPRSKVQDCEDPHPGVLPEGEGDGGQSPSYDFEFDYQIPLLSLPGVFKTTLETIPAQVPYLFADEKLVEEWREKLAQFKVQSSRFQVKGGDDGGPADAAHPGPTLLVGINWQGRKAKGPWQARDIPLEMLESLADIPGVQLVSLQKDAQSSLALRASMTAGRAGPAILNLGEFDTVHGAFMDTAAIMMNLDLVITSDTSVAHLAGALGVPVWVALPFVPDWRWLLDRSDSPWYPTMRLFRQKSLGEWAGVFEEIRAALAERVKGEPAALRVRAGK